MSEFFEAGVPLDPAAYIAKGLAEGMSGNAILSDLKAAGAGMNRGTFFSLVGEIRDAMAGREAIQALDYNAIPDGEIYSTWRAGAGDQFATFVTSYVRPKGALDVEQRFYTHISSDPHSPQDALDAAQGYLDAGNDQGSPPGGDTVLGSVVTSMARTVARG